MRYVFGLDFPVLICQLVREKMIGSGLSPRFKEA
jgi:hypothetical protein